ncbi:RNB domain-containing ribonuclease [Desulfotalea psychrophila]|uniref:Related to ribonuclease R n=1 Tax=Desulfotalea psychrophila (strain LSv54 / DSM 12343) TaxID=177439 RepID=Q6AMK8_DESPS|nr:RNB domain-containing ribonuclease [Desulfotalea psychrophila]CAG36417.1 related to ribonuclease R [Desulfotalea psychrophila LSv54]
MEEVNLEELWELTTDEPTSVFSPAFLAELAFGKEVDDDLICSFLRCIFTDKLFFKYKEGRVRINNAEQIAQLRMQQVAEEKKARLVKDGSQLLRSLYDLQNVEELENEYGSFFTESLDIIRDFYLFGSDFKQAATAKLLLKEASLNHPHAPFSLMEKSGRWSSHENIPLLRSEIPVAFSLAARQQAEQILQTDMDKLFDDPARIDYTHLKPITIDGPTTQDFDDALTIEKDGENYLVGVHISDVAHYVRPGDPLFQEAMQRGTSIYFPEGQIPMLPRHLSQGICSLIQGEIRAALSFMILLSPEAEVLRVRIRPSIIKVARRLTYEEADSMLKDDNEIKMLNKVSQRLRQRRIDNGALLLPFPDVNIFIDNQGKVHVQLAKSNTPARVLVSEMMILANSESARYVADRMVPGIYRSQPELKNRIVHGTDDDLFQNTKQRKQLPRGELSTVAKSHSGLGVSQYTTITSPIRRLLDLVMQHQLHSIVRRQEPRFTEDMCSDFTAVMSRTLSRANNVRHQRHRYWLLCYLEERKGQYLEALVIQAGPKRTNLLLTDILLDVELPATGGISPGQRVKIRVAKADALDNVLRFEW